MSRTIFISGALSALSGAARADTPMNYMRSFGPAADPVTALGWGLLIISVAVMIIIAVLLLGALFRRRSRMSQHDSAALAVTRDEGGLSWIYIGVGISAVVLLGSAIWTFTTLAAVSKPPTDPKLTLNVIGHQWWWEANYASDGHAPAFVTANEFHIPVGRPVRVHLSTDDVIHSFWVPQLAGKTDMIPGITNAAWLQADKPGVYRGQCTEYCGLQHAHMALQVVAQTPKDFAAWRRNQAKPAARTTSHGAQRGHAVFQANCSVCHAVRGTGAMGILGPDLTHVMSRRTIAAGTLINNTGNLAGWISDAQHFKPGTLMPTMTLSGRDLVDVVAYVKTLY